MLCGRLWPRVPGLLRRYPNLPLHPRRSLTRTRPNLRSRLLASPLRIASGCSGVSSANFTNSFSNSTPMERFEARISRSTQSSKRHSWVVLRVQDVTARHLLEERLHVSETMLENAEEIA